VLEDAALELTANPTAGEAFTATGYGANPYDLGAAGVDPAVGEPLQVLYEITEAFDGDVTTVEIALVNDTDGAGTSAVDVLTTGDIAVASAVAGGPLLLGIVAPKAITKQFLTTKCTLDDTATAGKVRMWLQKGAHTVPVNAGAL
jgi:hypothetical protein